MSADIKPAILAAARSMFPADPGATLRAIDAFPNSGLALDWWQAFAPMARAAIEVMREPTEEMCDAGSRQMPDSIAGVFGAMIDAALAEGK